MFIKSIQTTKRGKKGKFFNKILTLTCVNKADIIPLMAIFAQEEKPRRRGILSKVLFVGGILVILILLAWAVLNFVPAIFSSLANVGSSIGSGLSNNSDDITVLVNDNDLNNGDQFSVYWRFTPTESGFYSISHECVDGIMFDVQLNQDTKRLICNLPMTLPENTASVNLIAYNNKANSFADVPVIVEFTPTGSTDSLYSGETIVTIKNGDSSVSSSDTPDGDLSSATITSEPVSDTGSQQTTNEPQSQPQTVVQPTTPIYVSQTAADLAISNLYSYPYQSAFQFDVYNIGGQNSGVWQFSYTDPSEGGRTQYSPLQPSLAPGQGMRFSLAFNSQEDDAEVVYIRIDPSNTIFENSENNNTGTVTVTGYGTGINYYNNNNNNYYNSNDDADLEIEDLEVGRISGNRFIEDDSVDEGDDIAIRFEVRNVGGESTGSWRFEIRNLPFDDDDDYRSSRQSSLRPGEWEEYIVEFDNVDEGNYTIRVEVDSDDDVDEEEEDNNDDSVRLEVDR